MLRLFLVLGEGSLLAVSEGKALGFMARVRAMVRFSFKYRLRIWLHLKLM